MINLGLSLTKPYVSSDNLLSICLTELSPLFVSKKSPFLPMKMRDVCTKSGVFSEPYKSDGTFGGSLSNKVSFHGLTSLQNSISAWYACPAKGYCKNRSYCFQKQLDSLQFSFVLKEAIFLFKI